MKVRLMRNNRAWAVLGLAVALAACGLDQVGMPDYFGPAELAVALRLTVSPDVLVADGVSTAVVRAEVRGVNGALLPNVDVFFALSDEDGRFADIGRLSIDRRTTDGNGVAEVTYYTPARTDATANQTILIQARPVGNDAAGQIYRQVRLELRSAEPKIFPQVPDNKTPKCAMTYETPGGLLVGRDILFQDVSSDEDGTIVRYMWDFGDGSPVLYYPDVNHAFGTAGVFTVTHTVVDDDGGQATCTQALTIN